MVFEGIEMQAMHLNPKTLLPFSAEDDLDRVAEPHNLQTKCHTATPLSASQIGRKPLLSMGLFRFEPLVLRHENITDSAPA